VRGEEGGRGAERGGEGRRGAERGGEGRSRWFGLTVVEIPAGKAPNRRDILLTLGDFSTIFIAAEIGFPVRVAKVFSGSGFFRSPSFLPVSGRRGRVSGRRRAESLCAARRGLLLRQPPSLAELWRSRGFGAQVSRSSRSPRRWGPFPACLLNSPRLH
jgi:hypothetical protein